MFEKASKLKLRFPTTKGLATVEDLWDLPLTSRAGANLNGVAVTLHDALESVGVKSFVKKAVADTDYTELRLDIVKHVIAVKLAELEAAKTASAKRDRRAVLTDAIARKENEALGATSLEDLKKELADT